MRDDGYVLPRVIQYSGRAMTLRIEIRRVKGAAIQLMIAFHSGAPRAAHRSMHIKLKWSEQPQYY